jgi:hypothetical protein
LLEDEEIRCCVKSKTPIPEIRERVVILVATPSIPIKEKAFLILFMFMVFFYLIS